MSITSLRTRPAEPDNDEDLNDENYAPPAQIQRTSDALAQSMLDAALTPRLKRLLAARPRLLVFKTADATSAGLLERYLSDQDRTVMVAAYTERQKTGGRLEPHGRTELDLLERGRSVILISHDPEHVLVSQAVAGADAVIEVPAPDLAVIRKTIRMMTGRVVRGLLPTDVEGLSVHDLIVAIRPGLSSWDCVLNLRRMAKARREPDEVDTTVPLENLPMTESVSTWAYETLALMRQVVDGKVDPSALRYACLEGPPGTGKTTIAAGLARSAGWRFASGSVGSWFAESGGHLGDVIRAARRFFDEIALSKDPVVGLLDEIDAIPNRATMDADDASWWTPLVTFVLTEVDRLRKLGKPIMVIGATNHVVKLDMALIRAGRLERRVSVQLPSPSDRRRIFASYIGDLIHDDGIATLARLAIDATPAQIESWCQSAMAKASAEERPIMLADLVALIARPDARLPDVDRAIAIHEAGHAVVAHALNLPIIEVSILGDGAVGGWVKPKLKDGLLTRHDFENLITMVLAGRAADVTLGNGANSGAEADLKIANMALRSAMLDVGLYGPLTIEATTDPRNWSNNGSLWMGITSELDRLYDRATAIVGWRRNDVLRVAEVLLLERVITGDRLVEIFEGGTMAGKTVGVCEDRIAVVGRI